MSEEYRAIVLKDGTQVPGCWVSYDAGSLWIYCDGMTMREGAKIFLDPEKTSEIRYIIGAEGQDYEGFTACMMLNQTPDALRVLMMREAG